jgi:hypothetical protein
MSFLEPFPDFNTDVPDLEFDEFIDYSGGDDSPDHVEPPNMGFNNDDSFVGLADLDFDNGFDDFTINSLDGVDLFGGLMDFNIDNSNFISNPGFDEVTSISFVEAAPAAKLPLQQPPCKRKAFNSKLPHKKPSLDVIGPIEAMWSPVARKSAGHVSSSLSPRTPKRSPGQLGSPSQHHFTPVTPPGSCPGNPIDIDALPTTDTLPITASELEELLDQNPDLVYGTPHHNATPALPYSALAQFINMTPQSTPFKKVAKRPPKPKPATGPVSKVTKKTNVTPRKVQAPPTPADSPERRRSIEDLLIAPFITLTAQEKLRVLLPLLRGMNPRLLEKNLGEMRGIQARGPGHEKHVAAAIFNSAGNDEADNILARELTFGQVRNTAPRQHVMGYEQVPVRETSPLAYKSATAEIEGRLGAMRQREALRKAAVLRDLGRKR